MTHDPFTVYITEHHIQRTHDRYPARPTHATLRSPPLNERRIYEERKDIAEEENLKIRYSGYREQGRDGTRDHLYPGKLSRPLDMIKADV
jgi:hypothetical protein